MYILVCHTYTLISHVFKSSYLTTSTTPAMFKHQIFCGSTEPCIHLQLFPFHIDLILKYKNGAPVTVHAVQKASPFWANSKVSLSPMLSMSEVSDLRLGENGDNNNYS